MNEGMFEGVVERFDQWWEIDGKRAIDAGIDPRRICEIAWVGGGQAVCAEFQKQIAHVPECKNSLS